LPNPGKSPPPPLLFLACLLAGWGLGFVHPLGTGLPRALRLGLGSILLLLAFLNAGSALLTFRRWRTTVKPNGEASALLSSGPFRWTRNPLYLSLAAVLAGCGLTRNSGWMLLLVPGLVLLLDRLVIAREEVRLRSQFGDDYLAYTQRVRRWL
jgi:protein-S-isoprenylcysteine O-methyltransferase Ste14